ncbi:Phosphotransferase system IIC components, glucose/maltose/N-acetylglucosamine-specific [Gracilibacillus orientalis]|uniref:Phosphotransferase system IIC components, glucose/maltose/N-acetylglucosamine-specific n=1 Tax=Gracilibacillus orientalis TaxID=334253 RepID=A0A1I4R9M7_9BACI|nr:PTS sugar transporter [Gracilibacillus orientalis]SFM48992.1 Phosphotransferase system IIC components, glucose/maltose/N-acetylglucosamine-specific [Gracilibacillus orientalis]
MKKIAIIGSSGGNLFNLGGKNPEKLLEEIRKQTDSASIKIEIVQFIGAEISMDSAKDTTKASLWTIDNNSVFVEGKKEKLKDINQQAQQVDLEIADKINNGEIDGLIVMSGDPAHTNKNTIEAASRKSVPIVGTGGTSMATIASKGANVISTSGTTGTTNRTRAVSFITSLSKELKLNYRPILGSSNNQVTNGIGLRNINIRGIMMSALPGFIAMALILALSKIPGLEGLGDVFDLLIGALPVVIAVIAAKQVSELDEVSIVAGVIAGVLSVDGGIIGGIIAGILAGLFVRFLFKIFVEWRFPMTTVNIASGGFAGLGAGLLVFYLIAPVALFIGDGIKELIETAVEFNPILAGAIAGVLIWPAIIGGVYHAAILPIVLLEMERTGNSFLGAIDMVGLVMVAAGINLANIIRPRDKGEAAVAVPGFAINMGFGTFVESAYPFMFSSKWIFAGALLSGGVGGVLVGLFEVKGTAYVPTFTAPLLANNTIGFVIAMIVPCLLAFIITLVVNSLSKKKY